MANICNNILYAKAGSSDIKRLIKFVKENNCDYESITDTAKEGDNETLTYNFSTKWRPPTDLPKIAGDISICYSEPGNGLAGLVVECENKDAIVFECAIQVEEMTDLCEEPQFDATLDALSLLAKRLLSSSKDDTPLNKLEVAIISEDRVSVDEILKENPNIGESIDHKDQYAPAILACMTRNKEILQTLLENGIKLNDLCLDRSPVFYAIDARDNELLDLILSVTKNPNASIEYYGDEFASAISVACATTNIDAVNTLIRHGANTNEDNESQNTTMDFAIESNDTEIVETILNASYDIGRIEGHLIDMPDNEVKRLLESKLLKCAQVKNKGIHHDDFGL